MVLIKQDWNDKIQKAEYIEGTHGDTATNVWTGTSTTIRNLKKGQVIYFKLSSAGTSTQATLNLTLVDGVETGAKNIYFNNTISLTTQFGAGAVICLVFDGSAWRVIDPYTDTNNYDRLVYGANIKAGESLVQNGLIYGRKDKLYYNVASGGLLDVKHPILQCGVVIASGSTSSSAFWYRGDGVNLSVTKSGHTHTNLCDVYIEGVRYSDGEFLISSNVFVDENHLTKGNYYIRVGSAYNTTSIRFVSDMAVYRYNGSNLILAENSDIQYGGRNLIPNSKEFVHSKGVLTDEYYNSCRVRSFDNSSGTGNLDCDWELPVVGDFRYGDYYTLSFWAKGNGYVSAYSYGNTNYIKTKVMHNSFDVNTITDGYADGLIRWNLTNDWRRYYVTWQLNPVSSSSQLEDVVKKLLIRIPVGSEVDICGVMFERGVIPHDWTPAPTDVIDVSEINGLSTVATTGSYVSLTNKPSFTQDSGITSSTVGRYAIGTVNINGSNVTLYGKDTNTTYTADNSTLQLSTTTFKVKNSGINTTQLANSSVTNDKIANATIGIEKLGSGVVDSTSGGTNGSANLITSGAVYNGLSTKSDLDHEHGNITNDGKVTATTSSVSKVLVAESDGKVKSIAKLPSANVTHQSLTNYIQKSNTSGLVKNDGTIDTTDYAESEHNHQYLYQYEVLSSGTDLNHSDYRSPGLYAIPGTVSKTIVNRPFSDSYLSDDVNKHSWLKIEQYKNGGTYGYIQIYYSMNTKYEHIFYRTSTSSGWNSWKKIANIDEIPTKVSDLINDSGFLTTHQSLTNYIQKSNTIGLVKNDGSIDTNNYLTSHQDLSDYIQKSNNIGLVKNDGTIDASSYALSNHTHDELGKLDGKINEMTGEVIIDINAMVTDDSLLKHMYHNPNTNDIAPTVTYNNKQIAYSSANTSVKQYYYHKIPLSEVPYNFEVSFIGKVNSTSSSTKDIGFALADTTNNTYELFYLRPTTGILRNTHIENNSYSNPSEVSTTKSVSVDTFYKLVLQKKVDSVTLKAYTLDGQFVGIVSADLDGFNVDEIGILVGYQNYTNTVYDVRFFDTHKAEYASIDRLNDKAEIAEQSAIDYVHFTLLLWETIPMYKHWTNEQGVYEQIDFITLRVNDAMHLAELKVFHTNATVKPELSQDPNDNSTTMAYLNAIPSQYRPSQQLVAPMVSKSGRLVVDSSGDIFFQSADSSSHGGVNANSTLMWCYQND